MARHWTWTYLRLEFFNCLPKSLGEKLLPFCLSQSYYKVCHISFGSLLKFAPPNPPPPVNWIWITLDPGMLHRLLDFSASGPANWVHTAGRRLSFVCRHVSCQVWFFDICLSVLFNYNICVLFVSLNLLQPLWQSWEKIWNIVLYDTDMIKTNLWSVSEARRHCSVQSHSQQRLICVPVQWIILNIWETIIFKTIRIWKR